jgi:hypothetical protein
MRETIPREQVGILVYASRGAQKGSVNAIAEVVEVYSLSLSATGESTVVLLVGRRKCFVGKAS